MFSKACPNCMDMILVDSVKNKRIRDFLKKRDFTHVKFHRGCNECQGTGQVLYSNQPYVEFIIFDDDLVSALLECRVPSQMERILRERVNGCSLEDFMCKGVKDGELQFDALSSLV